MDSQQEPAHPEAHAGHVADAQAEREALGRIVFAYRQYRTDAEDEVKRWEANYERLPLEHRALLHTQPAKYAEARRAIYHNHLFLSALLAAFHDDDSDEEGGGASYMSDAGAAGDEVAADLQRTPCGDVDKVRYVLKNLARDWSEEGAHERAQSYGRILQELQELYRDWDQDKERPPRVLVPGCGLGRLPLELAAAGFEAQGNEFSYFMLLAGSFMMNHSVCTSQWTIHPWLHSNCNHTRDADQLRGVPIPDINPVEVVGPGLLSMCAGDFVEVYSRPRVAGTFDAVITCFFLDTAHNFIEYLQAIHNVLRPGGYWVNLGPLLWHWADAAPDDVSVEVSLAEVARVATLMGFKLMRQSVVPAAYIANIRSMYQTVYQASFWTMVKCDPQHPQPGTPAAAAPPAAVEPQAEHA